MVSFQTLYDHLMVSLGERGIDNQFVSQLVDAITDYEHACYIKTLEDMQSFFKKK